jgi:hypothetical protein
VAGVNLWGGFDAQWASSGLTIVTGGVAGNGEFYTILAAAINTPTLLSDLEITEPDATTPGKSSYGVHITNSTSLTLQRVTIQGGSGADGSAGTNGTNSTTPGSSGGNGGNADEFNTAYSDDESGDGGTGVGSGNRKGGNGSRGGYMDDDCDFFSPDFGATGGVSGANATDFTANGYGYRGSGSGTCNPGNDGNDGQTVNGNGGGGAASSANIVGLFWEALSGVNGTLGEDGTCGGGSGGCDDGTDSYGAGGGGEGGLKASTFAAGGLSGGNSAAVFMLASTCSFIDCEFSIGSGGNGAVGGNSGTGSPGGTGGSGGNSAGDSDAGGSGGNGAAGGNSGAGGGGAGGGGAGGMAYGIYGNNSTANRTGSTFNPGNGGQPGAGGTETPSGVAGTDGIGASSLDVAGTVTDSIGALTLEEDPCTQIVTTDLITLTFCAGETTTVDYNAVGSFSGTNTFTAQLSDATGDFTSPTDIGSVVSNVSGTVTIEFPVNTASGTAYRIRIVSSATPAIGSENATDIVINPLPAVVANASTQTVCAGNEVTFTGSGADTYTWDNGVTNGTAFAPQQTGYFSVEGINTTTLCANVDSVEITVVNLPDTFVVQNGNQLAAVLAGAGYQWVDCDDNYAIIPGADEQTFAANSSGNYAVVVTMSSCSDTSSCYNVMTVGIEDQDEQEHTLIIYPNPSTGIFQMISDVEQPMGVSVFNAMGQMVYSEGTVTNNTIIDLSGVTNGLYSIQFHNEKINLIRQVITQN